MNLSEFSYNIIRSNRKTMAIQIKPNGEVLVRAPLRLSEVRIRHFVESRKEWILSHLEAAEKRKAAMPAGLKPLTDAELDYLKKEAKKVIPERVRYYAPKIGVTYGRITIRNQKTRWGSCSAEGNLNFNCALMMAPPEVLDSVVVHELCHRKHMDHSKLFYNEIYRVFPDYDKCHKWLRTHGSVILARCHMN